ncbi:hypothetical protein NDU88_008843 [Pleurodeles waltl]|uniref:Uncharacterized protein n=1 Tax=Pleurodeles waltl TaxID=8319 RepID=A0AAV7QPZ1_PLEWA|nr:hypothetical protein NDU88_008843 [Pleurodeles waltl]
MEAAYTNGSTDRLEEPGSEAHKVWETQTVRKDEGELQRPEQEKRMDGEDEDESRTPETCLRTTPKKATSTVLERRWEHFPAAFQEGRGFPRVHKTSSSDTEQESKSMASGRY